jgi:hypothetical protein
VNPGLAVPQRPVVRSITTSKNHHGSHRTLLRQAEAVRSDGATVQAIIVPTARSVGYLRSAVALAAELNCTLVALCSMWANAKDVARLAGEAGVEAAAVDFADPQPAELLPRFGTTDLLVGRRRIFRRQTDTSGKRNLGLLLARMMGWDRVVFLDDDIAVPRAADLTDAVRLLGPHAGVGLRIGGYPDNSVVCHANRESGGFQETFVGGGALAVGRAALDSFFPEIYNEDWFFLLDDEKLKPTAITGTALQKPYDPFANDRRARSEEFGDCLAEGVYWLLDNGRRVQDADQRFWAGFLGRRQAFIDEVLHRLDGSDLEAGQRDRMRVALRAARARCQLIEPILCVEYLRAWRADRTRWRRHLDEFGLPVGHLGLERVLDKLGLRDASQYVARRS